MALIHLDAGVIIGFLDRNDAHHDSAHKVFSEIYREAQGVEMAASALAECLVGPARRGADAVITVRHSLAQLGVHVVDLDSDIATEAAQLRAAHRQLRLPDALVIATARVQGADRLVSTDRGWPKGLDVDIQLI